MGLVGGLRKALPSIYTIYEIHSEVSVTGKSSLPSQKSSTAEMRIITQTAGEQGK